MALELEVSQSATSAVESCGKVPSFNDRMQTYLMLANTTYSQNTKHQSRAHDPNKNSSQPTRLVTAQHNAVDALSRPPHPRPQNQSSHPHFVLCRAEPLLVLSVATPLQQNCSSAGAALTNP